MTIHSGLDDLLTSPCDLEAELIEYRQVERGVEVDIKLQVLTADTKCVWEGQITLLSRNSKAQASGTVKHKNVSAPSAAPAGCKVEEVGVARDTGVQYAQVSGDWNPHHLYPWSARLLGYRRPIAHGMWTLARSLATLQDTVDQLSYPVYVEANFKRPLFMPGWCLIQYRSTGHASHWFRVADKATGVPHLIGSLTYSMTEMERKDSKLMMSESWSS